MTWWKRDKQSIEPPDEADRHVRTEGLWIKCEGCGQIIWRKTLEEACRCVRSAVTISASTRATRCKLLFDDGEYEEFDDDMVSTDPLGFRRFQAIQANGSTSMREATDCPDAVVSAGGLLNGRRVYICALELKFIGGSMGAVVGEKITRAIERADRPQSSR